MRLTLATLLLAGAIPATLAAQGSEGAAAKVSQPGFRPDPQAVLNPTSMVPRGTWREARVPDTLDLAERAALAINGLIGDVDPQHFYGVYQGFKFNVDPPAVESGHTGNAQGDALYGLTLTPRNVRTLPMLRAMSGSDFGLQTEYGMMRSLLDQIQANGEMDYPSSLPGLSAGLNYPERDGMMAFAILTWQARDQNPAWLAWLHLLADGLKRDAVHRDDRAYYPIQSAIDAEGRWHDIAGGAQARIPYHTPEEPVSDQQGTEGTAKQDQLRPMSTLVRDYELNGDQSSLVLAQELSREILRPALWAENSILASPGAEHAAFEGHFHATVHAFISLLDLADAENNAQLREFAREGYEAALQQGVVRLGWFPAIVQPAKFGRPAWQHTVDEACGVGDMVVLAIRLSDAGVGDYWDDVDSIVRNQLSAQQVIDIDLMRQAAGTDASHDALLQNYLGGFGNADATSIPPIADIAGCCTGNASQALYYAWEGITRYRDGVATVNLFLNRASPWLDVDSYLPYEGKVVLHNKQAHKIMVRIPSWLEGTPIAAKVNGRSVHPAEEGRWLVLDRLTPGEVINLTFPVFRTTTHYTIDGTRYAITFRGSTVVDISPRNTGAHIYPIYLRQHMDSDSAPMHEVRRFVADNLIDAQVF
jgi:hypothetical protein